MIDYVHEHFAKYPDRPVRPHIITKRGGSLSVQAGSIHYCTPREDEAEEYSSVEVWWNGDHTPKPLRPYCSEWDRKGPASYVPVSVVNALIARRGGLA